MKRIIFLISSIIIMLAIGFLVLKPVPILPEEELLVVEGKVENVFEAGEYDIVFQLADSELMFYINRGMEHGFDIEDLKRQLLGRNVTFKYPDYKSFFGSQIKHVSVVRYKTRTIFSECPESEPIKMI